jgi:deazaflavin-dependent oxidoreductase (nitroreductase family)
MTPTADRYVAPSSASELAVMRLVRWMTRHGLSLFGSRVLTVAGRTSGTPRSVPVNLMPLGHERYLVAPRGVTQWVRNVRAAEVAELRVGRRVETVRLVEVPVDQRVPVLRVYLDRWGWEVGRFVDGLTARSTDAELAAAAPGLPVFLVRSVDG